MSATSRRHSVAGAVRSTTKPFAHRVHQIRLARLSRGIARSRRKSPHKVAASFRTQRLRRVQGFLKGPLHHGVVFLERHAVEFLDEGHAWSELLHHFKRSAEVGDGACARALTTNCIRSSRLVRLLFGIVKACEFDF